MMTSTEPLRATSHRQQLRVEEDKAHEHLQNAEADERFY
jgi:hypothetical protein